MKAYRDYQVVLLANRLEHFGLTAAVLRASPHWGVQALKEPRGYKGGVQDRYYGLYLALYRRVGGKAVAVPTIYPSGELLLSLRGLIPEATYATLPTNTWAKVELCNP